MFLLVWTVLCGPSSPPPPPPANTGIGIEEGNKFFWTLILQSVSRDRVCKINVLNTVNRWTRSSRMVRASHSQFGEMATVLASSQHPPTQGRQMKQCWKKYWKNNTKIPPLTQEGSLTSTKKYCKNNIKNNFPFKYVVPYNVSDIYVKQIFLYSWGMELTTEFIPQKVF